MAPSVQGLLFKDLKQILRKEQCDASILITANVPSAKKIVVHGPNESDSGAILFNRRAQTAGIFPGRLSDESDSQSFCLRAGLLFLQAFAVSSAQLGAHGPGQGSRRPTEASLHGENGGTGQSAVRHIGPEKF